jgi:AcrR family transcriptional regulator
LLAREALDVKRLQTAGAGDGRARILAGALRVFATHGFEGSSLRQIANEAGEQHQLLVYHFKTKDALWREVVASIFEEISREQGSLDYWSTRSRSLGPAKALREMFRALAVFTARRPEFQRLLSFEGFRKSERLTWLLQNFVRPYYEISIATIRAAQEAGQAQAGDPGRLHYAVIGLITHGLVFSEEFKRMTRLDPFSAQELEHTVGLACRLLGLPESDD